jgi:hypothetical protein
MKRANFYVDEQRLKALKHLAVSEESSVAALVREAIDLLLVSRAGTLDHDDWRERLKAIVAETHAGVPRNIPMSDVDADIEAALAEVRSTRAGGR